MILDLGCVGGEMCLGMHFADKIYSGISYIQASESAGRSNCECVLDLYCDL